MGILHQLAGQLEPDGQGWPQLSGLYFALPGLLSSSELAWACSQGEQSKRGSRNTQALFQASTCIKLAVVPLAKTSHTTQPGISGRQGTETSLIAGIQGGY